MFWQSAPLWFAALGNARSLKCSLLCNELNIPVNVTAQAVRLPSNLTYELVNDDFPSFIKACTSAPIESVTTSYNVSARYCHPTVSIASRSKTLQLLVHGITYTKDYWSGLAAPGTRAGQDRYSWVSYAASQGYPTLSIDRPCNGNSTNPNGLLNCQLALNTAVMHAITQLARTGKIAGVATRFHKIVYVGHSYGSQIGADLSVKYPTDIEAYVMTGYSQQGVPSSVHLPAFMPAAKAMPARFGFLTGDPSYLTATRISDIRQAFYYGDFDESELRFDFDNRGRVAIGELAISLPGQSRAANYTGALFVLNGNEDLPNCSRDVIRSANVTTNCNEGYSANVRNNYPAVGRFGFHNTAETGHDLHLHRTAQESFHAAHAFLASTSF